MPNYKLTYFNAKGVAEPIRFLFAWNGVDFEDNRVNKDDWPVLKLDQPFGQLPVLDTGDAVLLTQSLSIARYLGKIFGLSGSDDLQNAQLDGLVEHMLELHLKHYKIMLSNGDTKDYEEETIPFYFRKFNAIASQGWFYGSTPTWADIYFAGFIDTLETRLKKQILDPYPHLKEIHSKVLASETVQNYLEKRPFTDR